MATYTQGARVGELKTPLGQDKLVLTRLSGTEGVSELFEFRVECVNEKDGRDDYVDFDPALGKTATVAIETISQGKRYFAGTVTEAQRLRETATDVHYVMVLRPWLWALSRKINSLIFHEMTAPDIIAKIFGEHGSLADYDNQLKKNYPTLEYCVQHRESDMNFVCRLMEAHGISYHFKFGDNQQTLVMGDETSSYADAPGTTRKFYPIAAQHQRKEEHFFEWMPERRFTTGKTMRNDYDFEKPTANLKGEKAGDAQYANGQLEDYGHPYHSHVGKDVKQDDGQAYAEAALNMALAEDKRALASGDCLSLAAGMRMRLANHDNDAENQEYLVLRCAHDFFENAYRSGQGTDDPYRGSFELLPTAQNFAPPMVTPKPFIAGPQTAKVVGDGEIDTDKYGRIKVHFHWDRKSEDEPDGRSMWCRVAQVWGRGEMGRHIHPAQGHGSAGPLHRRRPGPAGHHRLALQRRQHAAVRAAEEQERRRLDVALDRGRRRRGLQRIRHGRHPKGRTGPPARAKGPALGGRERRKAGNRPRPRDQDR